MLPDLARLLEEANQPPRREIATRKEKPARRTLEKRSSPAGKERTVEGNEFASSIEGKVENEPHRKGEKRKRKGKKEMGPHVSDRENRMDAKGITQLTAQAEKLRGAHMSNTRI